MILPSTTYLMDTMDKDVERSKKEIISSLKINSVSMNNFMFMLLGSSFSLILLMMILILVQY